MIPKNFSFRYEWLEAIDSLDFDEQIEVLQAVAHFSRTGQVRELSYYADEIFRSRILPTLERRRKAACYRARANARRQRQPLAHGPIQNEGQPQNTPASTVELSASPLRAPGSEDATDGPICRPDSNDGS